MQSGLRAVLRSRVSSPSFRNQVTPITSRILRPSPLQWRFAHSMSKKIVSFVLSAHNFIVQSPQVYAPTWTCEVWRQNGTWNYQYYRPCPGFIGRRCFRRVTKYWNKGYKRRSAFSISITSQFSTMLDPIGAVESVKAASDIVSDLTMVSMRWIAQIFGVCSCFRYHWRNQRDAGWPTRSAQ